MDGLAAPVTSAAGDVKPKRNGGGIANFGGKRGSFAGHRHTAESRAKMSAAGRRTQSAAATLREARKREARQEAPWTPNPRRPFTMSPKEHQHRFIKEHRAPSRLRARAKALGLPVTDYEQTLAMAVRYLDGGRVRFLQFVELAAEGGDEDAQKFMAVWADLNRPEQLKVALDLVCVSAGVSRVALLKAIVGIAFEHFTDVANLVAAAAHPALVEKTIRSAERLNSGIGQRDRHALLAHAGFLPTPRGTTVNVHASASALAGASAHAPQDASLPSFLTSVDGATAARDVVKQQILDADVVESSE